MQSLFQTSWISHVPVEDRRAEPPDCSDSGATATAPFCGAAARLTDVLAGRLELPGNLALSTATAPVAALATIVNCGLALTQRSPLLVQ